MRDRKTVVFDYFARNFDGGGTALGSTLMAIAQESSGSVDESTRLRTFWIFLILTILMIASEVILLPHFRGKEKI
ncbi:adhesin [Ligilactobacillus ruminis]|uniref:adhesin n=1 Tax=Ligilactobacillus ruminis TaxID=1623 RepID=UPI00031224CA|nr:adhesin [Ligilactobacillus ruminis]